LSDLEHTAQRTKSQVKHLGLFRDFDDSAKKGSGVPDPYYGGDRGFDEVLDQCERACAGLIRHLREHHLA
jgi:protein-tyrosine phosphatase